MQIETTRFGKVEISREQLISFPMGLLGFESKKSFFINDTEDISLIVWLQSKQDPELAFAIIESSLVVSDYDFVFSDKDLKFLPEDTKSENHAVYLILTIHQDQNIITANLKAPIVIDSDHKVGKQIVLHDNKVEISRDVTSTIREGILTRKNQLNKNTTETTQPQREEPISPAGKEQE